MFVGKCAVGAAGLLIVDGYNVLHGWRRIRGASAQEMAVARQELNEAVRVLAEVESLGVTVVYDGRVASTESASSGPNAGVRVVFAAAGLTADGAIERLVAAQPDRQACLVVTADFLERETVRALGADCISPDELKRWVARCREQVRRKLQRDGAFENRLPL